MAGVAIASEPSARALTVCVAVVVMPGAWATHVKVRPGAHSVIS